MIGNQEFAGTALAVKALRETQLSLGLDKVDVSDRLKTINRLSILINSGFAKGSESQCKALSWLLDQKAPLGPDDITEARIKALEPIERLSHENRTRRGKVRKVRAFGARVLNVIGAGHSGPIPWLHKGGSQYQALRILVGRCLLRETYTEGVLGWEEGEDLRSWIDAGGFL